MNLNDFIKPVWEKYNLIDNQSNTWCNVYVAELLSKLNYHNFEGRTANRIIEIMQFDKKNWEIINPDTWDKKSLVIAGQQGVIHGHVCPLIDGEYDISHKWHDQPVPLCANIGKTNFWGKGISWAFVSEPIYFKFLPYIWT
jgi:hypothetical protein